MQSYLDKFQIARLVYCRDEINSVNSLLSVVQGFSLRSDDSIKSHHVAAVLDDAQERLEKVEGLLKLYDYFGESHVEPSGKLVTGSSEDSGQSSQAA